MGPAYKVLATLPPCDCWRRRRDIGLSHGSQEAHPSMTNEVILRLFADQRIEWCAVGGTTIRQDEWPLAGSVIRCLLLPAEWVLRLETPRVSRSLQTLRQAIPYAIEDRLVAPVEQAHVALGAEDDPASVVVRVVDRERLRSALDACTQHGLTIRAACSEAEVLPVDTEALLWFEAGRVLFRPSPQAAVVVSEESALPDLLKVLPVAAHGRFTVCSETILSDLQSTSLDALLARRVGSRGDQSVAVPGAGDAPQDDKRILFGNLLQQDFAVRAASGDALQWWKRAAWVAALAVGLLLVNGVMERQQLQAQLADTHEKMANVLREAVPGVSQVVMRGPNWKRN